ncbi:TLR4 regulator and MIR-interacting MSAP-domain-containing protein [Scenedesmus sp. NREL 46B-D3]|nr:TLR4 regulator and MIR-interacting MSAP-domain-containing protein [Scenedesmus sp. NREL 46B-D3]
MQLETRRSGVAVLSLMLLMLLQLERGALAIEGECSACEAVAAELQRRLESEHKRAHLDMRHRLDKDGNRYGKILDYKVSEQRAVNLLDDLCSTMDDYTLIAVEGSSSSSSSATNEAAVAAAAAADAGVTQDSSSDQTAENGKKKRIKRSKQAGTAKEASPAGAAEVVWVKYQGIGGVKVPKPKR